MEKICMYALFILAMGTCLKGKMVRGGVTRNSTLCLQGLGALAILLHHIHNRLLLGDWIIGAWGYLSCGIFFFISGYGNELSLSAKGTDLAWLWNKIKKLYKPFIVCYVVYYLSLVIFQAGNVPTVTELIFDLCSVSLPNLANWFPKVILVCFALHWLVKKYIIRSKGGHITALFAVAVCYIAVMYLAQQPTWWYNSVLCYPVGVWFAQHASNQKKEKYCLLSFVGFFWCFVLVARGFITLYPIRVLLTMMSAVMLSVFCFYFVQIFEIRSRLCEILGKNSFEIFLFQTVWLNRDFDSCNKEKTLKAA